MHKAAILSLFAPGVREGIRAAVQKATSFKNISSMSACSPAATWAARPPRGSWILRLIERIRAESAITALGLSDDGRLTRPRRGDASAVLRIAQGTRHTADREVSRQFRSDNRKQFI